MSVDIAQLGFRVESLEAEIAAARLDKMTGSARRASTASERLAKSAMVTSKAMRTMGRNMTLYVTTPLLAAAAAAVKLGTSFDHTLTKMNTLVGVSRKEIQAFRKDILALGPSVGRGPVELADALFAITSAGQRGAQAMDTLRKSAMASAIGLGETRTIALAATAAVQAYGKANLDSTKSLEILIGTIEKGNIEASELAPVLGRVIGIAAELGVAFEDLGAFIATFSLLGVNSDEAATSLRSLLSAIQKPDENALKAFKALNTTIEDVRQNIRDDGFIVTFQELVRESRRLGVDLTALIPNVRALSGALGVFGGEGKIAEQNLEGIVAAIGTLDQRFEDMAENDPSFEFAQMRSELEVMAILISRDVLPTVLSMAREIRQLAKAFGELNPETQKSIVKWGLFAAAMGPVLIVLASLARLLSIIVPGIAALATVLYTKLLPSLRLTMIRLAGLAGSMGILVGPGGLILAGVAALGFLAAAMWDTEQGASSLELEIEDLIANMELFGRSAFELQLIKMGDAIEINEAHVASLNDSLKELLTQQGIDEQAWRADRIDYLIERIAILESEGDGLENMLRRLIKAKEDLDERLAHDAMMERYAETMAELAKNMAWLDSLGDGPTFDSAAFAELLDMLDPSIQATKDFDEAWSLLVAGFNAGKFKGGERELKRFQTLLRRSTLGVTAFGEEIIINQESLDAYADTMAELEANFAWLDELVAMEELSEELDGLRSQFDPLIDGLNALDEARLKVQEGFDKGLVGDDEFDRMMEGIDEAEHSLRMMHDTFAQGLGATIDSLAQVRDLFHEDSAAAEGLNSVLQILNVVAGVYAVIKQLQGGDVYSAIPRALGVAALIASMGVDTGAAGSAEAERTRQESQGTGSVLGDAEAKSESILRATEITADATSELVGINRGMLHALTALQGGLEGAVVQLARGADIGSVEIPKASTPLLIELLTGSGIFDLFGLNFIGDLFGKLLGGKVKILDEGLQIEGGALTDLMNEVIARAFVDIKIKKHFLDDYDLKTKFADLDEEVGKQFALVFQSIYDTVEQAAIALGVPLDDIQARLESFEIETIKISLEDLTAEEQREEILAVFSKIFDDLAGHVIPFIDDFQKVGEGLGETLVRVATSVQVMQEAIGALGLTVGEMSPEDFAFMSVELVELVGGVENFISSFSTFFDKFASDERKLAFATSQLSRAFESVGLTIPETRDGMVELMMSLDATTESGRAQIAMLLEIAAVADEYYDLVADGEESRIEAARDFLRIISEFTGSTIYSGLTDLRDSFNEAMEAADALNATQREYAMITRAFNTRLRRMAAELTLSVMSLTKQLFGDEMDELAGVIGDGLEGVREVANDVFDDWTRALEDIYNFTQSLLLDEQLTTLTPAEQLAEADLQFSKLLAAARAGDVEAAAALPDAAQALLEEARFMFASGEQYTAIFDRVTSALAGINMPSGITPTVIVDDNDTDDVTGPLPPEDPNDALARELERFLTAMDLAETLRDLSQVLDTSVLTLAEELNIPLGQLVEILGVELGALSEATATQLADVAVMLGANVFELMQTLGVSLAELATASGVHIDDMSQNLAAELGAFAAALGVSVLDLTTALGLSIAELATTFEIGVESFSAEQFAALVAFSEALGIGVADVAAALDINLGEIADATSLLSESLDLAIAELPEEIQADLGPLLEAIRTATTAADANLAIDNLGTYILGLPADLQLLLSPFLELVGFAPGSPELSALMGIEANTDATVRAIHALVAKPVTPIIVIPPPIHIEMGPILRGLPAYADGGAVDRTGPAMLHAGEFVVTKTADNLNVSTGDDETSGDMSQVLNVLVDIREQNRRYQEEDLRKTDEIEQNLRIQTEQQRRAVNG